MAVLPISSPVIIFAAQAPQARRLFSRRKMRNGNDDRTVSRTE
jgi:hypothetical protein